MSDIDFDELDRAVASALTTDDTKQAEAAPSEEPEALLESGLEPDVVASEPEPMPTPASMPAPAPAADPESPKPVAVSAQALHPVAQKPVQRGRFLDMVHPAHDMGPRTAAPSLTPITRSPASVPQAANQTFVSDVVAPEPAPATEPVVAPVATPKPVTSAPEAPEHDPADFFAGSPPDEQKADEPVPSPFIPDAKVEKRPLGAFNAGEAVQGSSPLPVGDELHAKLVQVESDDNIIETAESPIPSKIETAKTEPVKSAPEKPEGRFTISPVSASQPSPAIVNVASAPVAKPRPEKAPKHGKGVIIWATVAVAVILIGFGVGATLYFIVLK